MGRGHLAALAALASILLAGCGTGQGMASLPPGGHLVRPPNTPTVYEGPLGRPYRGKLPFRMLWPTAEGYNCNLAIYYPGSSQTKTSVMTQTDGQSTGTSTVQMRVTVETSVNVTCFPTVGSMGLILVKEASTTNLTTGLPIKDIHIVRLGSRAAQEGTLAASGGGAALHVLMLRRGSLHIVISGTAPWSQLQEIALSLHA